MTVDVIILSRETVQASISWSGAEGCGVNVRVSSSQVCLRLLSDDVVDLQVWRLGSDGLHPEAVLLHNIFTSFLPPSHKETETKDCTGDQQQEE